MICITNHQPFLLSSEKLADLFALYESTLLTVTRVVPDVTVSYGTEIGPWWLLNISCSQEG